MIADRSRRALALSLRCGGNAFLSARPRVGLNTRSGQTPTLDRKRRDGYRRAHHSFASFRERRSAPLCSALRSSAPPACGNAARAAHLSRLASDPEYRIKVQQSWHENQIKTLKDNFAKELAAAKDEARRELTTEIVSVRRELIAARSEADQLRVANADLQRRLQDDEAAVMSLKADKADLQRQLEALNNISAFLAAVGRGPQKSLLRSL
jgi:hypothetical protein